MKQVLGIIYNGKRMELSISSYKNRGISINEAGILKDKYSDRLKAYNALSTKIEEVISESNIKHVGLLKDVSYKHNFASENQILNHILYSQKGKLKLSSIQYKSLTDLYNPAKIYGDTQKERLGKLNKKYAVSPKINNPKDPALVSTLILLAQYKIPAT